ncbi:hypothetical protein ES705_35312 [subsurface metagenome]
MRFKIMEITPWRLCEATIRRVKEIPYFLSWRGDSLITRENRSRLEKFRDKHAGQRCFVMGNGPSLSRMDLSVLKDEITFGMNRIYLLFDEMPFIPTYYTCVNDLVLEQFADDIQALPMPKFLNWTCRDHFNSDDINTIFIRLRYSIRDLFVGDPAHSLCGGGTVTYAALQLAYYMGFKEVVLIGVDHSFKEKGRPNKTEVRISEVDESHCHPNYFPKGIKWQLPDLLRSELAYAIARKAFEKDGRVIRDATVEGQLDVFEKVDFTSLF